MYPKSTVLIVDDDASLCDVLIDILEEAGFRVLHTGNGSDAVEIFKNEECHAVLLDLLLPGLNGLEVLEQFKKINPVCPVIMMSGHGTIQSAVQATQNGAFDWLEKPMDKERILITLRNAVNQTILTEERNYFHKEIKEKFKMIGSSEPMQTVYSLIDKVAPTRSTVIITGESGTGKELVARAIHFNSPRAAQPFVEINCAAVPDTLIESELFGHVKGAFTGAHKDKKGKFQVADCGTLFMDEIGDLSPMAQAKVLNALESGQIYPVGKEKPVNIDVRFITATNKNLIECVNEGKFREDLFHRINVIAVNMPPLRARKEDIPVIFNHFLQEFAGRKDGNTKRLSPNAEMVLLAYEWPGNVRELRNIAEKAMVLADESVITGRHIARFLKVGDSDLDENFDQTFKDAKWRFEKSYLMRMLEENNWHISNTARAMNMYRSVLYKKMEKYGIKDESR